MRRTNGSLPAKRWYDGLEEKGQAGLLSAAATWHISRTTSRPGSGYRYSPVRGSKHRLQELRATRIGTVGGHPARAFALCRGNVVWIASGISKQDTRLKRPAVEYADLVTGEWKRQQADRRGSGQ
jgi:hypothetical protein